MIPFIAVAWYLTMPPFEITEPTNWYEQEVEEIRDEPGLEDIEREIYRKQFRILEAKPDAKR